LRRARPDDRERGAILILAAFATVLAVVSAALAVDLGRQAGDKRDLQAVADLASLDAVRVLKGFAADPLDATLNGVGDVLAAARTSAARNDFAWDDPGHELLVTLGSFSDDPALYGFTPLCDEAPSTPPVPVPLPCPGAANADAVQVRMGDDLDYLFLDGGRHLEATATARLPMVGGSSTTTPPTSTGGGSAAFQVGSRTASFDSTQAALLDKVLEKIADPLGQQPGEVDVTAAGYDGLATTSVDLGTLATKLGLASPDQLLTAEVTLADLFEGTAEALYDKGTDAAAATVEKIAAQVDKTLAKEDLGPVPVDVLLGAVPDGEDVDLGQAAGATVTLVAGATLNVLDLVRGAAAIADGDHFVALSISSDSPLSSLLPDGATQATLGLTLVEAPSRAGPTSPGSGVTARTAQLATDVTLAVSVPVEDVGVLDVELPVSVRGGGAQATLTAMGCADTTLTSVALAGETRTFEVTTGGFTASIGVTSPTTTTITLPSTTTTTTTTPSVTAPTTTTVVVPGGTGVSVSASDGTPVQWGGTSAGLTFPADALHDARTIGPETAVMPVISASDLTVQVGDVVFTPPAAPSTSTGNAVADKVAAKVATALSDALAKLQTKLGTVYDTLGVGWTGADFWILHDEDGSPADGPSPVCTSTTTPGAGTVTPPTLGDVPKLVG
jgi:uncharacterized membrane protein